MLTLQKELGLTSEAVAKSLQEEMTEMAAGKAEAARSTGNVRP